MDILKSPREILFEMAGVPSMAKGGIAQDVYKMITDAIEKYTKVHGRPPNPEDVKALKEHAAGLSKAPEIKTDPATQARARHELATDPNIQNPDLARDPFLTKMLTGRTVKGTYLKPKSVDITDPGVRQSIDERQVAGKLDEVIPNPESITPSADYISRMATGVENEILGAGKIPLIDKLKQAFYKANNRFPTQEELDTLIAEFNPARHQYGERGASIVTDRPKSRVGQEEWRARARMEGIPEAYLNKPPADYPQYLRDELSIKQGVQPGTAPHQDRVYRSSQPGNSWDSITDELGNPIQRAGGGSATMTPREMQAMLAVKGRTPPSLARRIGNKALQGLNIAQVPLGLYETADSAHEVGRRLASKDYLGATNKAISTAGSALGTIPGVGLLPGLGIYALGETLDYLNEPEEYAPVEGSSTAKVLAAEDPKNKNKLMRPTTDLDYYLANQWVDATKQR